MTKADLVYGDSCIFLAYFNGEPDRVDLLEQLFEQIQTDPAKIIVTSTLSIAEAYRFTIEKRYLKPDAESILDEFWSDIDLISLLDFSEAIARQARTLMRRAIPLRFSLRLADAIHLATAQLSGVAEFFTYDDLKKYEPLVGFKIVEPHVIEATPPDV